MVQPWRHKRLLNIARAKTSRLDWYRIMELLFCPIYAHNNITLGGLEKEPLSQRTLCTRNEETPASAYRSEQATDRRRGRKNTKTNSRRRTDVSQGTTAADSITTTTQRPIE